MGRKEEVQSLQFRLSLGLWEGGGCSWMDRTVTLLCPFIEQSQAGTGSGGRALPGDPYPAMCVHWRAS